MTTLACVELRNMHPCKHLLVHHLEVNLEGSVRIVEVTTLSSAERQSTQAMHLSHNDSKVLLLACEPPLNVWFNILEVGDENGSTETGYYGYPITVSVGEAYTVVYRLSPKSVVNEVLSTFNASTTQPTTLPLSSCGLPPVGVCGDFISPVEARWTEMRSRKDQAPSSPSVTTSEKDLIVSSTSLCWRVEKRSGEEFTIEFEGPSEARVLEPFPLRLIVTNFTGVKRSVQVYLQRPNCDDKLFHISDR